MSCNHVVPLCWPGDVESAMKSDITGLGQHKGSKVLTNLKHSDKLRSISDLGISSAIHVSLTVIHLPGGYF